MTLPTAKEILNLYLYGQKNKPSEIVDSKIIRPPANINNAVVLDVDINEYMDKGPGRFATAASFGFIGEFFKSNKLSNLEAREYSKTEILTALGYIDSGGKPVKFAGLILYQRLYQDQVDDLLERAFIWNTTGFKVSDDTRFVIGKNSRTIKDFSIVPYSQATEITPANYENFDLKSDMSMASRSSWRRG